MDWKKKINNVPQMSLDARPDNDTWLSIQTRAEDGERWHYFTVGAGFHGFGKIEECERNLLEFAEKLLVNKLDLIRKLKDEVNNANC